MKRAYLLIFSVMFITSALAQSVEDRIRSILDQQNFDLDGNIQHTIYSFDLPQGRTVYLAFTTSDQNGCHACSTIMSVFVVKDGKIEHSYIKAGREGSWGEPPEDTSVAVYPVGNSFVIVIRDGYLAQGIMTEGITCYYPEQDSLRNLGNIQTFFDNTGLYGEDSPQAESWEAKYMFIPKKDGIPDLILNISGTKGGKRFTRIERYVFNGQKYVKAE